MLKHLKSTLASLFAAALLLSALAVPASAANTGAVKDASFNHDIEQVQDVQVINRELHVSYAVTGQNDRAAIIGALNALTVSPMKAERGEEDGLRLLTVLMKNGDRHNYWCYADNVLQSDGWQAAGKQLDGLYAAMDRCQQNYPANIEWLGYMNPYRVTKVELSGTVFSGCLLDDKNRTYESAASQEQREQILDLCGKLKDIKVGRVQKHDDSGAFKEIEKSHVKYTIRLDFENGKTEYQIGVSGDKIAIRVGNISYELLYDQNDAILYKALTDTLDTLVR